MQATHMDAELRYNKLRKMALSAVSRQVPSNLQLNFELIDQRALDESKNWLLSKRRLVDWKWFKSYHPFKYSYPKRFELALWHKGNLASLSLGRPTYSGTGMRLDFIEGNPDYHGIKVFPIVMAALTTYAEALGANELRVMNPINDEVRDYYSKFGLTYVANGDYLYTRL